MRHAKHVLTMAALVVACLFLAGDVPAEVNGGKGKGGPAASKAEPPFGKGDKGDKGDKGKMKGVSASKGNGAGKGK
jgi:hypothetical protein